MPVTLMGVVRNNKKDPKCQQETMDTKKKWYIIMVSTRQIFTHGC